MPFAFRIFATPERMAWIYEYGITWDGSIEDAPA